MTRGYFVTGTDTGVGKTVAATILAVGLEARYWKPIQTGARDGTDRDFAQRFIGGDHCIPETYIFDEPLSPHLAARRASRAIDACAILREFSSIGTPVIAEGAGGTLVPISSSYFMIDLIRDLELPAVVIASTRLGTINHTLLTLEALHSRRIEIAGFITTSARDAEISESIETLGGASWLGHIDPCEQFSRAWMMDQFQNLKGLRG